MKVKLITPALLVGMLAFGVPAASAQISPAATHFCNGLAHANAFRHNDAIAAYSRAIAANPRYAEAYFYRGNSYYSRGSGIRVNQNDLRGAIANWNQALNLGYPYRRILLFNRGNTRGMLGDYRGALADLNEVIRIEPSPERYLTRSLVYYYLGNRNSAIADLQRVANVYYQSGKTESYRSVLNTIAAVKKGVNPTTLFSDRLSWGATVSYSERQTRCSNI